MAPCLWWMSQMPYQTIPYSSPYSEMGSVKIFARKRQQKTVSRTLWRVKVYNCRLTINCKSKIHSYSAHKYNYGFSATSHFMPDDFLWMMTFLISGKISGKKWFGKKWKKRKKRKKWKPFLMFSLIYPCKIDRRCYFSKIFAWLGLKRLNIIWKNHNFITLLFCSCFSKLYCCKQNVRF